MGGKTAQSTSQLNIPPEVMARYNSVNARAQQAAETEFQPYTGQFVAPLTSTQQGAVSGVNAAQGMYRPYGQEAYQRTQEALGGADPLNQAAGFQYNQAYGQGQDYLRASTGQAEGAFNQGQDYLRASTGQAEGAFNQGQNYLGAGETAAYQASGAGQRAVNQAQEITGASLGQAHAAVNEGQPYQQLATRFGLAGAQAVDPTQLGGQQIGQFMSPYLQSVVSSTLAPLRQQQQEEQSALLGQQIGAGAFGGDRGRIAQANLARQQEMATAQTVSGLMNQGYGQALQTAQQQQGLGLSAAQANRAAQQQAAAQMAAIGQQGFGQQMSLAQQQAAIAQQIGALGQQNYAQGMGLSQQLQGLGAQGYQQRMGLSQQLQGLGAQGYQQGMGQGQANAALAQQIYGQRMGAGQQVGALGSQAQQNELAARQAQMGMGTAEQQTAQAQNQALYNQFLQQQGYPFQTAQFLANIAMGTGALSGSTTQTVQPTSFFSDRRLKHDIRKIGKTDDGMPIYKFKYKGDPEEQTHIGFMADEVEKKKPEAVGLAGGYKTVDYDKATKAHGGGLSSEGGAVYPERAGLGFASGGSPIISSGDLDAILAAQAQGLGLYSGTGLYGGASSGMPGLSGAVPASSVHVPNLATAAAPAPLPESGLSELADTAGKVSDMVDTGVNVAKGVGRAKDAYDGTKSLWEATKAAFKNEDEDEDKNYRTSNRDFEYGGGVAGPHSNNYAIGGMPYSQGQGYVPEQEIKTPDKLQEHQKRLEGDTQSSFGKDVSSLVKAGKTAASLYAMSDRRLKHDIRKIGETTDGLPIYKFKYKGDPKEQTHIGFMADEVEKKHPEAVGLAGGYKTVDYDKATRKAHGGLAGRHGYQTRGSVTEDEGFNKRRDELRENLNEEAGNPLVRDFSSAWSGLGKLFSNESGERGLASDPNAVAYMRPQQGGGLAPPLPEAINVSTRPEPVALDENVGLAGALEAPPAEATGIVPQGQAASNEDLSKKVAAKEAAEPGWFSRNQDWLVPLLKGVGTMASSPSRYLGAAVLQGVGAAAAAAPAYQQQKQEVIQSKIKTDAETLAYANKFAPNASYVAVAGEDPTGGKTVMVGGKPYHFVLKTSLMSGTGSAAEEPANTYVNTPDDLEALDKAFKRSSLEDPKQLNANNNVLMNQASVAVNTGTELLNDYNTALKALAGTENSIVQPGALSDLRRKIVSTYNTLLNLSGDEEVKSYLANDSLSDAEIRDKMLKATAILNTKQSGQTSLQSMIEVMDANPSGNMSAQTIRKLLTKAMASEMRNVQQNRYMQEFSNAVEQKLGPGTGNLFDWSTAFTQATKKYNIQNQIKEQEALNEFYSDPNLKKTLAGLLTSTPYARKKVLAELDAQYAKYGPNVISKYILGGM